MFGIELLLDEIFVVQRDALELEGDVEQRIVLDAELAQHLVAGLLHDLGARIVVLVDPVAEAHQAEGIVLVLGALDEFGDAADRADLGEHLERGLVGAAMRRAPQAGAAGGDAGERIGAGGAGEPHRRGRGVLLVVGVQDEDAVHGARQHRIGLVLLARHRIAHAQEVRGVVELVLRIHERLADRIFVGHRGQRRHLRDHADRGDHALQRIGDVGGVVIERRQRADRADHHRHRMGVAPEALEEPAHLLVHHRVMGHAVVEIGLLGGGRQLAVEQEIAGLEEIAVLGQVARSDSRDRAECLRRRRYR